MLASRVVMVERKVYHKHYKHLENCKGAGPDIDKS